MVDYLNSEYCPAISLKQLEKHIKEKGLIVEIIEGCRRKHIIAPFRLVKNILKEDSAAINKEFFDSEPNSYEFSKYIKHIQHNKDRCCFCFAINCVLPTPPTPVLEPEPEEPK